MISANKMGRRRCVLLLAAFVCTSGCRAVTTSYDYPEDLGHPNYVKRSKAVREFAQRADEAQLPGAFRLLLDDEGHIRSIAYRAIRDLSPGGEDFGYRPHLPRHVRGPIVERWRAWWVSQQGGEDDRG